jgi:hypothetical protein
MPERRGRRPQGARASTAAERQARYRWRQTKARFKALTRAAMIERDLDDLIGRYGKAAVRKAFRARVRGERRQSRHAVGRLMAEAEADLEERRRVRRGLLAAFYGLAVAILGRQAPRLMIVGAMGATLEIVLREDEVDERLADLLKVLEGGVYALGNALIEE